MHNPELRKLRRVEAKKYKRHMWETEVREKRRGGQWPGCSRTENRRMSIMVEQKFLVLSTLHNRWHGGVGSYCLLSDGVGKA